MLAFFTLATPLYLVRVARITNRRQIAIATGAFIVWAFAAAGTPFQHFFWYNHLVASIVLLLYCFTVPLINVTG